jgi:hypothetical protein
MRSVHEGRAGRARAVLRSLPKGDPPIHAMKDVENRWFLTKIDNVVRDRWGSGYALSEWIAKNQNLKVPTQ